jgi:4'-phosphopantetheinyl transferase
MPFVNSLDFGPVSCAWWPYRRGEVAERRIRAWLGDLWALPPAALTLARDGHGRPFLDTGSHRVDLNWSHSGDWLIAVCAERMRVGVDIEWLRPRPKALALAQRFYAPAETAWLASLADEPARLQHDFTRLWCAKEAVLKAHGHGLSFGLEKLRFELDDHGPPRLAACDPALGAPEAWRLHAWTPVPGYLATLACKGL